MISRCIYRVAIILAGLTTFAFFTDEAEGRERHNSTYRARAESVDTTCVHFRTGAQYLTNDTGNDMRGLVVADLNGDSKPDLVSADGGTGYVSVYLNSGTGTFASGVKYATTGQVTSVAVGDFNGDGKPDLAVALGNGTVARILLGNGNGTFGAATSTPAIGQDSTSIAVGDFNHDGKLDLAVANKTSDDVAILLGNGNGTFGTATHILLGAHAYSVAVGNFDGTAHSSALDLAIATPSGIFIYLGNNDGTFTNATGSPFPAGTQPESIAIGDFNNDGKSDLAVANKLSNDVAILLGNGDGTFGGPVSYGVGQLNMGNDAQDIGDHTVVVGDFNGDSKPDLAVASNISGYVTILTGVGNGTFTAGNKYQAGSAPWGLAVGDFNNDSKSDLAVANLSSGDVYVLNGNGDGTFPAVLTYSLASFPTFSTSVMTADFNGDGKPDVAITNAANPTITGVSSTGALSIYLGNGNGTFTPSVTYAAPSGVNYRFAAAGDFNHDGKLDLAVGNGSGSSPTSTYVSIFLGNGDGTFTGPTNFTTPADSRGIVVGDFNHDNNLDLAVVGGSNNVAILFGAGNGTFGAATTYTVGTSAYGIAAGFLNGDANLDLVVANNGSNNVSVLLGNSNGTFQTAVNYTVGTSPRSVTLGDFNGDGKIDLATANFGSDNVTVRLGNGDGTFGALTNYSTPTGSQPHFIITGDFNYDGFTDLATANSYNTTGTYSQGTVSVLLGNGNGTFNSAVNMHIGTGLKGLAAADVSNDGRVDLLTADMGVAVNTGTCPFIDLTISAISDDTTVAQGKTGENFHFTVTNAGASTSSGFVTVVATASSGLSPTAISGTGWTCILSTLTCTRNDGLGAGLAFPDVVVTMTVNSNAPVGAAAVSSGATVSGGSDAFSGNNTASVSLTVTTSGLVAPTRLTATAASTSQINLSWDPVNTAVSYRVYRRADFNGYILVGTPTTTTVSDFTVTSGAAYVYYVQAVDGGATISSPSNLDAAIAKIFTDDPLVAGTTTVKALHFTELRDAVAALWTCANIGTPTWAESITSGVVIKASHVTELRSNLNSARTALTLPSLTFTDSTPTTIKALHLTEIRSGMK